jgi:hypothetical protein
MKPSIFFGRAREILIGAVTKDMTSDEHTAYYSRKADEVVREYGLKLKNPISPLHDTV